MIPFVGRPFAIGHALRREHIVKGAGSDIFHFDQVETFEHHHYAGKIIAGAKIRQTGMICGNGSGFVLSCSIEQSAHEQIARAARNFFHNSTTFHGDYSTHPGGKQAREERRKPC